MTTHNKMTGQDIHGPISFVFADETARLVTTNPNTGEAYTTDDIGKEAWQTDDDTFYCLTSITPAWVEKGSSGDIDTLYNSDQTISGVDRRVYWTNGGTYHFHTYDKTTSDWTKSSRVAADSSAGASLNYLTGDGSGSTTTTNSIAVASAMTVTDGENSKGIVYAADYSTNYTDRSLVDKAYVDDNSGADTIYTADGELTGDRDAFLDGSKLTFVHGADGGTEVSLLSLNGANTGSRSSPYITIHEGAALDGFLNVDKDTPIHFRIDGATTECHTMQYDSSESYFETDFHGIHHVFNDIKNFEWYFDAATSSDKWTIYNSSDVEVFSLAYDASVAFSTPTDSTGSFDVGTSSKAYSTIDLYADNITSTGLLTSQGNVGIGIAASSSYSLYVSGDDPHVHVTSTDGHAYLDLVSENNWRFISEEDSVSTDGSFALLNASDSLTVLTVSPAGNVDIPGGGLTVDGGGLSVTGGNLSYLPDTDDTYSMTLGATAKMLSSLDGYAYNINLFSETRTDIESTTSIRLRTNEQNALTINNSQNVTIPNGDLTVVGDIISDNLVAPVPSTIVGRSLGQTVTDTDNQVGLTEITVDGADSDYDADVALDTITFTNGDGVKIYEISVYVRYDVQGLGDTGSARSYGVLTPRLDMTTLTDYESWSYVREFQGGTNGTANDGTGMTFQIQPAIGDELDFVVRGVADTDTITDFEVDGIVVTVKRLT